MKNLIIAFCTFCTFGTFAQLSGDIVRDGRKLSSSDSFMMQGSHNGTLVFDIAVNSDGEITAVKFVQSKSTISSTPARIKAQQYIADWTFEKGTAYPKFHQATIVLTMVREI